MTRQPLILAQLCLVGLTLLSYAVELRAAADADVQVTVTGMRPPKGMTGLLGERIDHADSPLAISRIPASALSEPGIQSISSVLARDASVGENYATTGYYENFTLRGFTLDLGSAYRINGFVVPGEFHIPLDNVDSVEVLKGVAGLHGGQVGAGGTINFVTRRPTDVDSMRVEVTSEGGSLVSLDTGRGLTGETGLGVRFNAAHAELRPGVPKAGGQRDLLSVALDARPVPTLRVLADLVLQRRSQPAVPGFQLLGGVALPDSGVRDININRQSWSRPVRNEGHMTDILVELQLSPKLWLQGGFARTVARIDDSLAFPWGCNDPPVQYFCTNGDYVLYDYHARERRESRHQTGSIHARADTGSWSHALSAGLEKIERSIQQDDFFSTTLYDATGRGMSGNLGTTDTPLPAPNGMGISRVPIRATQTAGFVADRIDFREVSFLVSLRAVDITQSSSAIRERHLLPQTAVTWRYASGQNLYLSRGQGVEFGSEAPLTAANAGTLMPPRRSDQTEVGWKGQGTSGFGWAAALFRMERPYEFTQPIGTSWAGLGDYVREGHQIHRGLDVSWHSPPDQSPRFEGSHALIRATATGTGVRGYDGVQLQNVPYMSSFLRADWRLSDFPGLEPHLAWTHRGGRNARRDGAVFVPGYDVVDAGLSWRQNVSGRSVVVALTVRNLMDRRYWRDVGEAYSADLLFPGARRSAVASIQLDL